MKCRVCQQEYIKGIGQSCSRQCHNRWINSNRNYADVLFIENMRVGRGAVATKKVCFACNTEFVVFVRQKGSPNDNRKFCSAACAHHTNGMNNLTKLHTDLLINTKRINTLKKRRDAGLQCGFINMTDDKQASQLIKSVRHSPKGERSIREALYDSDPGNWKAHRRVLSKAVDVINHVDRIVVEYDGEWHFHKVHDNHDFAAVVTKDAQTEQWCIDNNYKLYRISENFFKRILNSNPQMVVDDIGWFKESGLFVIKRYHSRDVVD